MFFKNVLDKLYTHHINTYIQKIRYFFQIIVLNDILELKKFSKEKQDKINILSITLLSRNVWLFYTFFSAVFVYSNLLVEELD